MDARTEHLVQDLRHTLRTLKKDLGFASVYWKAQFNGDASIVGRPVTLDGKPVTVVGVLPQSFDFGTVFAPGTETDLLPAIHVDDVRTWGHFFRSSDG